MNLLMRIKSISIMLILAASLLLTSCSKTMIKPAETHQNIPEPELMRHAISYYQTLEYQPWPRIVYRADIHPGEFSKSIPMIRQRLYTLHDLSNMTNPASNIYGSTLVDAVKHYQWRHGLRANGIITRKTINQLNVSPAIRLQQLNNSYQGWTRLPLDSTQPFIQVNIPSYQLNLIQGRESLLHMRVVVGKPSWRTPVITSKVRTIVLHPTWTVPKGILHKEIIPAIQQDPAYFDKLKIKVYKSWKRNAAEIHPSEIKWSRYSLTKPLPYKVMQIPGPHNALGQVKFLFNNKYAIYMHDTPAKTFFDSRVRALSHGCIRLGKPMALFEYLTENNTHLSEKQILEKLENPDQQYIKLSPAIPVYITYMTSWVDPDGTVIFNPDIYKNHAQRLHLGY